MQIKSAEGVRSRLISNRLWLLAAALGLVTIHLTMTIVHDDSQRREGIVRLARALADQAAMQFTRRAEAFSKNGVLPSDESIVRDSIFAPVVRDIAKANAQLLTLDSTSIRLSSPDSSIVAGRLDSNHHYSARAATSGALRQWHISVAISRGQLPASYVTFPDDRLWMLGLVGLLTITVIIIAVTTSQRELQLARARSDFVAGVSHELRMPLAQILLAAETLALERERNDTERTALSRSVVREARRLVGIVDNILFFSRSPAHPINARVQNVDVAALFQDVIDGVDLAVADARQSIEATANGLAVRADRELLRHALVNLVDNAIKYGKPGQCIRLDALATGAKIQINVDDEGPGIPESERTRVFDAYERLARDQVSERTGTGLGLAIVKRIVEACAGRVWIARSAANGARVTIELPTAT